MTHTIDINLRLAGKLAIAVDKLLDLYLNDEGETPPTIEAAQEATDPVEEVDLREECRQTALALVAAKNSEAVIDILEKHGCKSVTTADEDVLPAILADLKQASE